VHGGLSHAVGPVGSTHYPLIPIFRLRQAGVAGTAQHENSSYPIAVFRPGVSRTDRILSTAGAWHDSTAAPSMAYNNPDVLIDVVCSSLCLNQRRQSFSGQSP